MAGRRRELLTVSQLVHGGGGGELEKHVIRHLCQICCVRSISQSACAKSAANPRNLANLPPLAAHSRIPTKYYD